MTVHQTVVRIGPPGATAFVASRSPAVTAWVKRYFAPWWNAAAGPSAPPFPLVTADVDARRYAEIADTVHRGSPSRTTYAKARTHYTFDDDTVHAVSPDAGVAYRAAGDGVTVAGLDEQTVCLAAARIGRDAVWGLLERDGYTLLHGSAVTRDGRALLTVGTEGSGKTTTALLLARRHQFGLLSDDRVFARPADDGTVHVLPWAAALSAGLGLLDALGLYDTVRQRLLDGEDLYPTQDQRITDALRTGERKPLYESGCGPELTVRLFPDQLQRWLGLDLTTTATAAALLFPSIDPNAPMPATGEAGRSLGDTGAFTAKTENHYPDFLRLRGRHHVEGYANQQWLRDALAQLPHHGAILTHDTDASADALAKITASL